MFSPNASFAVKHMRVVFSAAIFLFTMQTSAPAQKLQSDRAFFGLEPPRTTSPPNVAATPRSPAQKADDLRCIRIHDGPNTSIGDYSYLGFKTKSNMQLDYICSFELSFAVCFVQDNRG